MGICKRANELSSISLKVFALVLFLLSMVTLSLGESFPTDFFTTNGNMYSISEDSHNDTLTITSNYSDKYRSFEHEYDSMFYNSSTAFEIIVLDYSKPSMLPVFCLNIKYRSDYYQNIKQVSFDIEDTRYTFSDIINTKQKLDFGIEENIIINFGREDISFLIAILQQMLDKTDGVKEIQSEMILHGDTNVRASLCEGFWNDFEILNWACSQWDMDTLWVKPKGTPMTTTSLE